MNAPPDDNTLTLWLDDELEGEQLARVDAWAAEHPEQLKAREQVREWRKLISSCLPAAEEPPAPEFFNERIHHAIRESAGKTQPISLSAKRNSSRILWMPLAACAGMILAFWLGAMVQPADSIPGASANSKPNLYIPEAGVDARWISSHDASATVIVLDGVSAIPDEVDFTAMALHRARREIDSTAASESPTPNP